MKSSDGGLAAIAYAPCVVETKVQGKPVKVEVTTDYPFRETIQIAVDVPEAMSFPLHLRIPEWTRGARILTPKLTASSPGALDISLYGNDQLGSFVKVRADWKVTRVLDLRLPMPVHLYHGFNDSAAIERGPLVYALKIGTEWKKVKDNLKFADWEVFPTTPWNYALQIDRERPERSLSFEERPIGSPPFSAQSLPVIARVKGRLLADWKIARGAAAPPPSSPAKSEAPLEELILIPYGCTDLRITEFPTLAPH